MNYSRGRTIINIELKFWKETWQSVFYDFINNQNSLCAEHEGNIAVVAYTLLTWLFEWDKNEQFKGDTGRGSTGWNLIYSIE